MYELIWGTKNSEKEPSIPEARAVLCQDTSQFSMPHEDIHNGDSSVTRGGGNPFICSVLFSPVLDHPQRKCCVAVWRLSLGSNDWD